MVERKTSGSANPIVRSLIAAARGGNGSAAFVLARICDKGWGVPKNATAAFRWYQQASRRRVLDAYYFVGFCYDYGLGVDKDPKQGCAWYKKAAGARDATAAYMYALCVLDGRGTRRQPRRGIAMLHAQARAGSDAAMDFLAAHFIKKGKLDVAERWARQAIKAGNIVAPLRLSEIGRRRAVKEIDRRIGRRLSEEESEKLRRAISGKNYGHHEIVEEGVTMFGPH